MDTILAKAREYIAREQDAAFRSEVQELIDRNNIDGLNDRFFMDLEFGTGGLRGIIGGGYNRMNPYTVARATQGLADYIKKDRPAASASAVIACDSRRCSDLFALQAARVFCGNGIKTYLFSALRPAPELSFAVRFLKAAAGIVITAGHNPPEYNGCKCYWDDGGQVVPPHDKGIITRVRAVTEIISMTKEKALSTGLLVMVDRAVDDAYIAAIKRQSLRPDLLRRQGHVLKVAYTPLHGAGGLAVDRVLSELGVSVAFVEEQRRPDGNFPTVKVPDPEEASGLAMVIALGGKIGADLVMGTDPDAGRLGIAVPNGNGFALITGNQLGALLLDYIANTRKELGSMPKKPLFIKTVVASELQRLIAESMGIRCIDVFTGFKDIGGEECGGCLSETEVCDNDAVSAAAMAAEMALYHKSQGRSLLQRLQQIWQQYGYFEEVRITRAFNGESGCKAMAALMDALRARPPEAFAGRKVAVFKDYKDGTVLDMISKKKEKCIELPSSNVLQLILCDGSIISARPSDAERLINFYVSCRDKAGVALDTAKKNVGARIAAVRRDVDRLTA